MAGLTGVPKCMSMKRYLRRFHGNIKPKEGISPMLEHKKAPATVVTGAEYWSGRWDSNPRRPAWGGQLRVVQRDRTRKEGHHLLPRTPYKKRTSREKRQHPGNQRNPRKFAVLLLAGINILLSKRHCLST